MDPAIPICPRCGAALRPEAPEGLCPVCLLVSADREIGQMEGQPEPGLADVSSAAPPAALGRIGNYELIEEIGRGGMGIVFRARQQGLNRIVAVKTVLGGQFSGAVAIARFLAEAELAAQLQHPGIVTIHEVGQHEGQPFFSMDYVEGRNLAEMVREHPLPARAAATYLQAIAEAIHYAHQCDVLTRRPPFVADTLAATTGLVKEAEPVPVRRLNPTVPADLETICLKCLEKDPGRRYPTAAALAEDLARFLRSESVLARPVGWMGHLVRWCRRKPVIAMLLGGLIILALAIVVGSPVAVYRIQRARQDMEREAYYANIRLTKTYIDQGNIDQALFILTNCPPQYRHWEWGHLIFLCHKDIASLQTMASSNYCHLAFSPKGGLLLSLVWTRQNSQMQLWDYQARKEVFRWSTPTNRVQCAAFDPQGNRLAAGFGNGWLTVWKVESPDSSDFLRDELREGPRGAVPNTGSAARRRSQDGSWTSNMAVEPKSPSPGIQEPPVLSFLAHTGSVEQIEWSRDGHQLVSCGVDSRVRLWDMRTGQLAQDWAGPNQRFHWLGFNRAQDRVFAWGVSQFIAWNRLSGKEIQRESLDTRAKVSLWPSPDADLFVTSDVEGRLALGPMPFGNSGVR